MKRTVGMTSGAFDVIHPGHVWFLNQCKKLCDELIVLVARDKITAKKKKSVYSEEQRLYMVESLKSVDFAIYEDEKMPPKNIQKRLTDFAPGMYITNSDNPNLESYRKVCDKLDIMFIVLKRNDKGIFNISTSEIIRRIKNGT